MNRLPLLLLALIPACASVRVDQTAADGRRTSVRASTWFSSLQSVERLRLTNTDKTQSLGAEDYASRGATNTAAVLDSLTRLLQTLPR